MARKANKRIKDAISEKVGTPNARPKGPISKADMAKALCNEGTYDVLDQWHKDIYFYAEGSDVSDAIRAINEKIEEDIYYSKLFVMEMLAAYAKTIDSTLLDKMVDLFCDKLPVLRKAVGHFQYSEYIELSALTDGLYIRLREAGKEPDDFIKRLCDTIPKEEWDRISSDMGKERTNIPLLVAMKAIEQNFTGPEWPLLQAIARGYDRRFFKDDTDMRWELKYTVNRVLDSAGSYSQMIEAYLPFLLSAGQSNLDPEIKDDILFWLTSRFCDLLQGNISWNEEMLKGTFEAIAVTSKELRPHDRLADRVPSKVWDCITEAMRGRTLSGEMKAYFAGVMKGEEPRGAAAQSLGNDVDAQLKVLETSTAPNERFFAIDRLLSMFTLNIIPLAPHMRSKTLAATLVELEKEPDRLVRNALIDLVLEIGTKESLAKLQSVLERSLDDEAWKARSDSPVNLEPYGELFYKDFPSRTVALMGIISKAMANPPDDGLRSITDRLIDDPDPDIKCLCYGYQLAFSDGDSFRQLVMKLIDSGLPFRAFVDEKARPLFGPRPIEGGIEFNVNPSEVEGLVSALLERYGASSDEQKASMRRILLQRPVAAMKDLFLDDCKWRPQDRDAAMLSLWLDLWFLSRLGAKMREPFTEAQLMTVRVRAQVALEAVLEDPDAATKLPAVDVMNIMGELGLKLAPMKLVDAVLNERLTFDAVEPALDVLKEGDWDIFLNETVNLFNAKLDGIERRLDIILTYFCRYIRDKHTKWYEERWHSILVQMVANRSTGGAFMGFWTEKDRELALFWVKEDTDPSRWSNSIAILWNISDEQYRIKKVVPAILKNWREDALWALGDLDRLEQPLDVISTDKALSALYEKVWDKHPDSRKALLERWFSTEHFRWAYERSKKAKGDERAQLVDVVKGGLEGLANLLVSRCRNGHLDPSRPFPGADGLVKVMERIVDDEPFDVSGTCTLAMFCLLSGGWPPFLGKTGIYVEKAIEAKKKGLVPAEEAQFTYYDDPNDSSMPALLLRAIGEGHVEALAPLMKLIDNELIKGFEEWAGPEQRYERLTEHLAMARLDPLAVAGSLEGHEDLKMAYLLRLRQESLNAGSSSKRPRPSDFGANPIVYDL